MENEIDIQIKVPNQTRYLSLIGEIGQVAARERCQLPEKRDVCADVLNVVLTEAMSNAIKHANPVDPYTVVKISISIVDEELTVRVYDNGKGFDLNAIPDPDLNAENPDETGRGLFIIRALMDSVVYKKANGGNVLEMKKLFQPECGATEGDDVEAGEEKPPAVP